MYSREQLKDIGMSDEQIDAIYAVYRDEGKTAAVVTAGLVGLDTAKGVNADNVAYVGDVKKANQVKSLNANEAMTVTSVTDLQNYSKGAVVRFPDFAEGQPFVARVCRPSMLVLAKSGKIPNALLASASDLFTKGGGGLDTDNINMMGDIYDITRIICEATLKEPTLAQIEEAGLNLTDEQLMAIFNYTQSGVKALESFR